MSDIEKASEIIRNAEEKAKKIIEEAEEQAKRIVELAQAKAERMISESALMKEIEISAEQMRKHIKEEYQKLEKVSDNLLFTKYYQTQKLTNNRWRIQKEKNGNFSVTDDLNKTILPAEYDEIELMEGTYTLFWIKKGDFVGLCDLEGFVLIEPNKYVDLIPQKNGLFNVKCKEGDRFYINIYDKKVEKE